MRGNIKLSLKATLPLPESEKVNIVDKSAPLVENINVSTFTKTGDLENQSSSDYPVNKHQTGESDPSISATPAFLVRSVAECEEEEKSAGLNQSSEGTTKENGSLKLSRKSKASPTQKCEKEKSAGSSPKSKGTNKPTASLKSGRKSTSPTQKNDIDLSVSNSSKSSSFSPTDGTGEVTNQEDELSGTITAKSLKIGTRATAKVYQIRAKGLVLDLGGGIRGMYRFEVCVPLLGPSSNLFQYLSFPPIQ